MMRRLGAITLAAALVGGLLAIPAVPAGAQSFGPLDIEPREGVAGDVVDALVDVDVVEDECITDASQLVPLFYGDSPDIASDNPLTDPGPVLASWLDRGPLIGIDIPAEWPPPPPFPPGLNFEPPANVNPLYWAWRTHAGYISSFVPTSIDSYEQMAAIWMAEFIGSLAGASVASSLTVPAFLEGSFILTFADVTSQELVGEMATFDPATGEGQIVVPDLAPGLWAVAAACIELVVTDDNFFAAIEAGAQYLESQELAFATNPFSDPDILADFVPIALAELAEPRGSGPWIDLFCILTPEGFCANPPGTIEQISELLPDDDLAALAEREATGGRPGESAELAVEAVTASPSFTG